MNMVFHSIISQLILAGGGGGEYGMEDLTLKYIHSIFVHFPVNNLLPD